MYAVYTINPGNILFTLGPTVELPCIYRAPLDIFITHPEIQLETVYFSVPTKTMLWGRWNTRWAAPRRAALYRFLEAIAQVSARSVAGEVRGHEDRHGVAMLWADSNKLSNPFHLCVSSGPLGKRYQRELEVQVPNGARPVSERVEGEGRRCGTCEEKRGKKEDLRKSLRRGWNSERAARLMGPDRRLLMRQVLALQVPPQWEHP